MTWSDFTDEELSMIASELAALVVEPLRGSAADGATGGFCCPEHYFNRSTITDDPGKREYLEAFAYDVMGCGWDREGDFDRSVRQRHLDNFLAAVAE